MRAFRMTKTLTSGNPAKLIFLFTIPLLIGNLFQQFYNMADTLIVGRTLGVEALAAVGCTGGLMFFILGFVIGFTAGLAIITAQRFGAGRRRAVRRSFAVCIVLSSIMTVLLTAVSVAFARPVLELLQTPPEILEAAHAYIIVISCASPPHLDSGSVAGELGASRYSPKIFMPLVRGVIASIDCLYLTKSSNVTST